MAAEKGFVQDAWSMTMLIIVSVLSIMGGYLFSSYNRDYNKINLTKRDDENYECVQLLPAESKMLIHFSSVSSITFFTGVIDKSSLCNKILDIMNCNPWLGGRLVRENSSTYLQYTRCNEFTTINPDIFSTAQHNDLHEKLSFNEIQKVARLYTVKAGTACINKDEALFKVTLIKTGLSSCALVVSLSHVVGDGNNMFTIYRMLGDNQDIITLNPVRDMEYDHKLNSVSCYHKERIDFINSSSFILNMVVTSIKETLFRPSMELLHIRKDWIEAEKQKYHDVSNKITVSSPSSSFVSTNDIITCWLFKLFNVDIGGMIVNYRNRIPGITESNVGNYSSMITYQRDDYSHPSLIRASLQSYCRMITKKLNFIPFISRFMNITNWSPFYTELIFEGCKEVYHLPIGLFPNAIKIFKSTPTQYSVLTSSCYLSQEELHRKSREACY